MACDLKCTLAVRICKAHIREGGHPTDPSNLLTLCHMCHAEWHIFWEHHSDWSAYIAATPYCKIISSVSTREVQPAQPGCCWRCGISAARCHELRPGGAALAPFHKAPGLSDSTKPICYWCRKEWILFWCSMRPNANQFLKADRFFKGPIQP